MSGDRRAEAYAWAALHTPLTTDQREAFAEAFASSAAAAPADQFDRWLPELLATCLPAPEPPGEHDQADADRRRLAAEYRTALAQLAAAEAECAEAAEAHWHAARQLGEARAAVARLGEQLAQADQLAAARAQARR